MSKIILRGHIIAPQTDLESVKRGLPTHTKLSYAETGCLAFRVTQDTENPCKFHVYEEFANEDSFMAHQFRVKNSDWGHISKNVERHYEVKKVN